MNQMKNIYIYIYIAKYFRRKSSLAYFQSALELLANLMQVTPFYFKLQFSVEKLMEIR